MKKVPFFIIGLISILLASCSSINLVNESSYYNSDRKTDTVKMFARKEKINHKGKRIGDFVLSEHNSDDWSKIRLKLEKFAKSNGANIIEFDKIGPRIDANRFHADGSLYFVENIDSVSAKKEEKCHFNFIRDYNEGLLGSFFDIDIKVDDKMYKDLKSNALISHEVANCKNDVLVTINNIEHKINFDGKSKYFMLSNNKLGLSPYGISISFNNVIINEINDEELGKFIFYQFKK